MTWLNACPLASRTMKQAPLSSISHGGGKRRGGSIIGVRRLILINTV